MSYWVRLLFGAINFTSQSDFLAGGVIPRTLSINCRCPMYLKPIGGGNQASIWPKFTLNLEMIRWKKHRPHYAIFSDTASNAQLLKHTGFQVFQLQCQRDVMSSHEIGYLKLVSYKKHSNINRTKIIIIVLNSLMWGNVEMFGFVLFF